MKDPESAAAIRRAAYSEGFSEGWGWAEQDLAAGHGEWWNAQSLEAAQVTVSDKWRAFWLGAERGYRSAFAAFERGTLTRNMFDAAPVNR